jgi:hypothetical protein
LRSEEGWSDEDGASTQHRLRKYEGILTPRAFAENVELVNASMCLVNLKMAMSEVRSHIIK